MKIILGLGGLILAVILIAGVAGAMGNSKKTSTYPINPRSSCAKRIGSIGTYQGKTYKCVGSGYWKEHKGR